MENKDIPFRKRKTNEMKREENTLLLSEENAVKYKEGELQSDSEDELKIKEEVSSDSSSQEHEDCEEDMLPEQNLRIEAGPSSNSITTTSDLVQAALSSLEACVKVNKGSAKQSDEKIQKAINSLETLVKNQEAMGSGTDEAEHIAMSTEEVLQEARDALEVLVDKDETDENTGKAQPESEAFQEASSSLEALVKNLDYDKDEKEKELEPSEGSSDDIYKRALASFETLLKNQQNMVNEEEALKLKSVEDIFHKAVAFLSALTKEDKGGRGILRKQSKDLDFNKDLDFWKPEEPFLAEEGVESGDKEKKKDGETSTMVPCDICKDSFPTQDAYLSHIRERKHLLKLKCLLDEAPEDIKETALKKVGSLEDVDLEAETSESDGEKKFPVSCDVCEVKLLNNHAYQTHLKGRKHHAKVKQNSGEKKLQDRNFTCSICQVKLPTVNVLKMHVTGAKHLATCAKMGINPELTEIPTTPDAKPTLKAELKGIVLRCRKCNLTLNSGIQYIQHIKSKRHRETVEASRIHLKKLDSGDRQLQKPGLHYKPFMPNQAPGNFFVRRKLQRLQSGQRTFPARSIQRPVKGFKNIEKQGDQLSEVNTSFNMGKKDMIQTDQTNPQFTRLKPKLGNLPVKNTDGKQNLVCRVCKIQLNSETQLQEHLRSKRHKQNLPQKHNKMMMYPGQQFQNPRNKHMLQKRKHNDNMNPMVGPSHGSFMQQDFNHPMKRARMPFQSQPNMMPMPMFQQGPPNMQDPHMIRQGPPGMMDGNIHGPVNVMQQANARQNPVMMEAFMPQQNPFERMGPPVQTQGPPGMIGMMNRPRQEPIDVIESFSHRRDTLDRMDPMMQRQNSSNRPEGMPRRQGMYDRIESVPKQNFQPFMEPSMPQQSIEDYGERRHPQGEMMGMHVMGREEQSNFPMQGMKNPKGPFMSSVEERIEQERLFLLKRLNELNKQQNDLHRF